MINKNTKIGDKEIFFGMVYTVVDITETDDPYLQYSKHFKAVCDVDNSMTFAGAITDFINPNFDLKSVFNGTKKSLYCESMVNA